MTKPNQQNQPKNKQRKRLPSDINCSTKAYYKKFIKETGRTDITYEMFSEIPSLVHGRMIEKLYTQSYFIRIPELGSLKLLKVKPLIDGQARIDWDYFQKTGERVYRRNSHTGGYMFKIHLYTYGKKYPIYNCFHFYPSRTHKRNMAKLIFNNKIK
jgi:hypothetical protein